MRLALISVSTEHEVGHGPAGMLPLFDGNVIEQQVRSVRNMGAEKIILLSPTMPGALLQYVDALKRQNIDAEIVRDTSDLGQYASENDDFIFLGDGILPAKPIEAQLSRKSVESIYVVTNADNYDSFERIDLSHRWLGIALLKAKRLEEISNIPDDWDVGSALLRTAVQSECERELVSDEDMQSDVVSQLIDAERSLAYADRRLGAVRIPKQNFLDRYVVWPLMRKLMPVLWQAPDAKKYFGMASIACSIIALGLGLIIWPAASLGFLFLGSVVLVLHKRISMFSTELNKPDWTAPIFYLVAAIVLTITVLRTASSATLFADISILLLLIGNLWLVHAAEDDIGLNWVRPDTPLILLALLIAAAFGAFSLGLYTAALFCLVYLVADRRDYFSSESGAASQK